MSSRLCKNCGRELTTEYFLQKYGLKQAKQCAKVSTFCGEECYRKHTKKVVWTKLCKYCGKEFSVSKTDSFRNYCSRKCRYHKVYGTLVKINGYLKYKLEPTSPYYSMCNVSGYVLQHRLVMAQSLNRSLLETEIVHHIDGNKLNNNIKNLQITTKNSHSKHHSELVGNKFGASLHTKEKKEFQFSFIK